MSKAEEIYKQIEPELIRDKGKFVAIDEASGEYFVGDNELDAYRKAQKKYPNKKFVFKRVGFKTTYFVGAF
ncbi:hypothetical protein HY489_00815 [Candidatus Woesearchaeota archaeon]|nr:hypothetical protein [Candidatus Woesearchaeota archaeon]